MPVSRWFLLYGQARKVTAQGDGRGMSRPSARPGQRCQNGRWVRGVLARPLARWRDRRSRLAVGSGATVLRDGLNRPLDIAVTASATVGCCEADGHCENEANDG